MPNLRSILGGAAKGAMTGTGALSGAFGLNPLDPVGSARDKLQASGHDKWAALIDLLKQAATTAIGGF